MSGPLRSWPLALIAALLAACTVASPGPSAQQEGSVTPQTPPPKASDPPSTLPAEARRITFPASDGVMLSGRLFGDGSTWVVLAHMGRPGDDQHAWLPFVEQARQRDVAILTFNRRGICTSGDECSQGANRYTEHWRDVLGAAAYAREQGAATVVVGGASIGAMASLEAVLKHSLAADGVVWFGGLVDESGYRFEAADLERLRAPLLVISSEDDPYGAARDARSLKDWLGRRATLLIVPGAAHGTDVWAESGPAGSEVSAAILEFLTEVEAAKGPP